MCEFVITKEAYDLKARALKCGCQLCSVKASLGLYLVGAGVSAVPVLLEHAQIKAAELCSFVVLILPRAKSSPAVYLILVDIGVVGVDVFKLIGGIYVKNKQPVGIKIVVT